MKAVVLAVALFGCWHFSGGGEPPPTESRVAADGRHEGIGRADAGVADAEVIGAEEADARQAGRASGGPQPGQPGQPGQPRGRLRRAPPVGAAVVAVPPGCVVGRVIGMTMLGSRSEAVLTVGVGSIHGVSSSWTAKLPHLPQSTVPILRVDKAVTVLKVYGVTMDALSAGQVAVFCP